MIAEEDNEISCACQLSHWHLFLYTEINTCRSCTCRICVLTVSDQLSARSQHIVRRVSFNPMVLTCRTSYFFLFLPSLAGLPQKKQSVAKENPPSDDLSTCLSLLVLGVDSSCLVSLATEFTAAVFVYHFTRYSVNTVFP